VSGGRKLAEIAGAEYVLHESANTQYEFRRMRDGELQGTRPSTYHCWSRIRLAARSLGFS
jgi:hypothetical protein